jgi:hypothetical protein
MIAAVRQVEQFGLGAGIPDFYDMGLRERSGEAVPVGTESHLRYALGLRDGEAYLSGSDVPDPYVTA